MHQRMRCVAIVFAKKVKLRDVLIVGIAVGFMLAALASQWQHITALDWQVSRAFRASFHGAYTTVHGDRIKVWGTLQISESSVGSRLSNKLNCEVKIPLMGRRIEKMILKGINDNQPTFNKTLADFIAKLDK